MELRDYLQMLRRRWPVVVLITALFFGCAALYLLVAPKRYESTTSLLVSANDLRTVGDLQSSTEFAQRAASTYAASASTAKARTPSTTNAPAPEFSTPVGTAGAGPLGPLCRSGGSRLTALISLGLSAPT